MAMTSVVMVFVAAFLLSAPSSLLSHNGRFLSAWRPPSLFTFLWNWFGLDRLNNLNLGRFGRESLLSGSCEGLGK